MSERIKCTECEYYDATPTTLIVWGKRVKARGWCTRDDCILNEGRDAEVGRIVRCKDCKYWQEPIEQSGYKYPSQCTRDERAYMEECAILMDADDFCSRGEKR